MGFEKVKELNADTTIRLQNSGDTIEGFYHGFKEIPGKFGVSLLHFFELETGENVGVWGSGRLNYGLKLLAPRNGQAMMLRVTCDGTVPSSKGNDAYAYTIEKDKSRLTEAAQAPESEEDDVAKEQAALSKAPVGHKLPAKSFSSRVVPQDNDEQDESEVEQAPPLPRAKVTSTPAHSTSAANKAKVNSILGIGSK